MESTIEVAFRLNAEAKFDFVSKLEIPENEYVTLINIRVWVAIAGFRDRNPYPNQINGDSYSHKLL
ncbi:hypothetical protein F7734_28515 [Scytonema sp. UIC 10036]|uniref:hypothetical protein n=1 Tax=Scytonema sp. UIC 10036 TaxID=2304196 RepID=UPI0012DA7C01|nr:hypothetical protein [Scytonema sp. UIC 10036]MUG96073.1 hypothetical protein [Scytonema sp. UIC 10036]